MIKNKAIVCIAAGPGQVLVIKKAKEMEFAVIAVDGDPEATGFKYADEKIIMSTYEPQPIIDRLHEMKQYDLKGVVNRSSGPPVVTAAAISEAFGISGVEPRTADNIVSKYKLNRICSEKNIPVPHCQSVRNLSEVNPDNIKYPSVIKPSLSLVGKSGVRVITNREDLIQNFQETKKLSFDGWVNIEEFVAGRDIYLMAMVSEGKLLPVVLLDEINSRDDNMELSGAGFAVPSVYTGSVEEDRIIELARDIVDRLGLTTTPFLMSCRCEKGGFPKLIEIHLDLGGDLVLDELLPASSSFDFIKYAIKILTGRDTDDSEMNFSPVSVLYGKGEGLVNERPFKLIRADTRSLLEEDIKRQSITDNTAMNTVSGVCK